MSEPILLQDRPVVVTGPGEYVTRDGRRVSVERIEGPATFNVAGYIWKEFRGKVRPRTWAFWHPCGAYKALGESKTDIVGPWVGE